MPDLYRTKHGHAGRGRKSAEYRIWRGMRDRCEYPTHISYRYYGARGITVCDRWRDFPTFLRDMGPRPSPKHSIDRKDGSRGYEPDNCRWATRAEQNNNASSNVYVGGYRVSEIAAANGVGASAIRQRIARGWSISRILGTLGENDVPV